MGVADFTGQPAVFIPNKWPISPKYPTKEGLKKIGKDIDKGVEKIAEETGKGIKKLHK